MPFHFAGIASHHPRGDYAGGDQETSTWPRIPHHVRLINGGSAVTDAALFPFVLQAMLDPDVHHRRLAAESRTLRSSSCQYCWLPC